MVKHVVMWRLQDKSKENLSLIKELLSSLLHIIDDIVTLETGDNFNVSDFAYDLVLITIHRDKLALEKYQNHPEHIKIANRIKELTKERVVVDFEY